MTKKMFTTCTNLNYLLINFHFIFNFQTTSVVTATLVDQEGRQNVCLQFEAELI